MPNYMLFIPTYLPIYYDRITFTATVMRTTHYSWETYKNYLYANYEFVCIFHTSKLLLACIHVIPSVMISVILQQAEIMRMLGWSTTSTFHSDDFTDRITSFRIPAISHSITLLICTHIQKLEFKNQSSIQRRSSINSKHNSEPQIRQQHHFCTAFLPRKFNRVLHLALCQWEFTFHIKTTSKVRHNTSIRSLWSRCWVVE